jgi:hypothetical protein
MQNEILAQRVWMQQQFTSVITNQRRYGGTIHSALARQHGPEQERRRQQQHAIAAVPPAAAAIQALANNIDPNARLMERPKDLYELYVEYQFGYGNNKPAKSFTTRERTNRVNGIKQKYSNRSKVWKLQVYLINAGKSIEAINAMLVTVYQSDRVTKIIVGITRDGLNPAYTYVAAVQFRVNPQLMANAR